ncbi:LOW QUALITY PROTEIN: NPC1-like intracellular cholesterol transporter 1 [Passer montanus]|uniref:LOW QUALITY PROTEIN: NPC1-like intracellular cholesterol transporter 1 n=1 Tax=Passer montanus TaxID=9160 RepID=UPI00196161AB|nr:LOW QUALITY PROTEIN: NPC1-like intracellular cholesterol transporter 1 [Passer montanus]
MAASLALPGALLAALLALASPLLTPVRQAGVCAFYGECGRNPEINMSLVPSKVPCLSNTPARVARGALLSLLRVVCPELARGDNETTRVCCSYGQLSALRLSVGLSGTVLARCPACARNFANLYCHNICSPDQSLFTNVTRVANYTVVPGAHAVLEYQLFYRRRYAEAAFASCQGVRLPATGGYAISTMCGRYGAQLCTAQRWLDYQGDKNNGLAPLQIDFQLLPNGSEPGQGIVPLDAPAWRCDQAPSADQEPCSCQDCAQACPPVAPPARWGTVVAAWPVAVLAVAVAVAGGLSAGLVTLQLTTDPVELWSAPGSRARQEKEFHDRHFGPFLRTNQVIVTAPGRAGLTYDSVVLGTKNFSGVLAQDVLLALLELQETLAGTTAWAAGAGRNVSLQDVCYAPLNPAAPGVGDCAVNSVTQYFQNNRSRLALSAWQDGKQQGTVDWHDHLIYCVNSPLSFKDITALELSCMAEYGGPVFPYIALGGYRESEYTEAEALIVTYSLNNFPAGDPRLEWALSWERQFLRVVRDFQRRHRHNLSVTFMAERSLEDEINRTSGEDLPVFATSYLLVFAYIALALGEYTAWRRVLVESKVTLALGGIAVVLGAVLAAMGLLALLGLRSSLIIIEVVPFLVLAVGADNIFIFVQELQQQSQPEPGETREQHLGRVLAQVAPSMLLCSLSETVCFLFGALSSMPAVRTFALTAALAIALDFVLQMSGFVALVALDRRRQEAGRFDLCCCCGDGKGGTAGGGRGLLRPLLERFYTPVLLHPLVRPAVVLLFLFLACAGLFLLFHVSVGLDQELALPEDSYLLPYFSELNRYLAVGVPTYFVTTSGFDFSSENGTNAVCSSAGCDANSLTQTIQLATRFPNASYLAIPATSWLDDFLDWLNPTVRCCRIYQAGEHKGEFCPSTSTEPSCLLGQCLKKVRRPTAEEFQRFLPWFLQDRPTLQCAKGGLGAYDTAVSMDANGTILATRFMAYQRPLRTSQEYTSALRAARSLAERITSTLRAVPGTDPAFRVFPYTVTYVYYEQYLTVVVEGLVTLALCLVPTFAVSFLLLGMDVRSSLATLLTIAMALLGTVGCMALWAVPYNAVALINLVAAVGISVEFVSHITCAFARSRQPTRVARAAEATATMGSKVVAGVAMTNLPGVAVLAFAKARLVRIFFFRLNLIVTALGLAHGLAFLPVLLSYIGPAPQVPAGEDTPGDTAQGTGLGLGNPCFKDKDKDKDKDKAKDKDKGPRKG